MNPILTALVCGLLLGIPLLALGGRMRSGTLLRLERGSAWVCFAPLLLASIALCFIRFTTEYAVLLLLILSGFLVLTRADRENRGRFLRHMTAILMIGSIVFSEGLVALSASGRGGDAVRQFGHLIAGKRAQPPPTRPGRDYSHVSYPPVRFERGSIVGSPVSSGGELSSVSPDSDTEKAESTVPAGKVSSRERALRRSFDRNAQTYGQSNRVPSASSAPDTSDDTLSGLAKEVSTPQGEAFSDSNAQPTAPLSPDRALFDGKEKLLTTPTRIDPRTFTPVDITKSSKTIEANPIELRQGKDNALDVTKPLDPPMHR